MPERSSDELTTVEGRLLLEEIESMGTQVVVLSGGDPLKRPDLLELIRYGAGIGLRMATIPAATARITPEILADLKPAGLAQIAFSLDASTEAMHDGFRQVPGTYRTTLQAIEWAKEVGLSVQINTAYSRVNKGATTLDVHAPLSADRRLARQSPPASCLAHCAR